MYQNKFLIHQIPSRLLTPEIYFKAACLDDAVVPYIPGHILTKEFLNRIIEHNPCAIQYMQDAETIEFYCRAVKKECGCLRYVPERFIENINLLSAVAETEPWALTESSIRSYITPEIAMIAVQTNGIVLSALSPDLKSLELCKAAIEQDKDAIAYVPPDIIELDPGFFKQYGCASKWNLCDLEPIAQAMGLVAQESIDNTFEQLIPLD